MPWLKLKLIQWLNCVGAVVPLQAEDKINMCPPVDPYE